jgi:hypothetical protein
LYLTDFSNLSVVEKEALSGSVGTLAKYLVDNFFLPCKFLQSILFEYGVLTCFL